MPRSLPRMDAPPLRPRRSSPPAAASPTTRCRSGSCARRGGRCPSTGRSGATGRSSTPSPSPTSPPRSPSSRSAATASTPPSSTPTSSCRSPPSASASTSRPAPVRSSRGRSRGAADLDRLRPLEPEADTPYVLETVRILVDELPDDVPVIGFAGAPFTVASYLVEGRPVAHLREDEGADARRTRRCSAPCSTGSPTSPPTRSPRRSPPAPGRSSCSTRGPAP